MINFFKGIIGGIGNIVPGLSGSALLIILNVYDKCINAITEIIKLKDIRKNIFFLIPIVLGIIVGTVCFSNIIQFLLKNYPMPTTYAFFGFILGTVPYLFKKANKKNFRKKYLIFMAITFILGISVAFLGNLSFGQLTNINFIQGIFMGFLLASSTIIPGISSTVLLSIVGMYDLYLGAVARVDILFLIPAGIGFIIGAVIFAFLINFLLKKYYGYTFYAIIGFTIATIPAVLRGSLGFNLVSLISCILALITFLMTYNLKNE